MMKFGSLFVFMLLSVSAAAAVPLEASNKVVKADATLMDETVGAARTLAAKKCKKGLTRVKGKCQCKYAKFGQVYDAKKKKCHCPGSSFVKKNKCVCKKGFRFVKAKGCKKIVAPTPAKSPVVG